MPYRAIALFADEPNPKVTHVTRPLFYPSRARVYVRGYADDLSHVSPHGYRPNLCPSSGRMRSP